MLDRLISGRLIMRLAPTHSFDSYDAYCARRHGPTGPLHFQAAFRRATLCYYATRRWHADGGAEETSQSADSRAKYLLPPAIESKVFTATAPAPSFDILRRLHARFQSIHAPSPSPPLSFA